MATILHEHPSSCWLECLVVMPDHVHLIVRPNDDRRLNTLLQRIKSVSSRRIGGGRVWHNESFDRILRNNESARQKAEYIAMNPVRKNLCATPDEYPWLWREWINGRQAPSPVESADGKDADIGDAPVEE